MKNDNLIKYENNPMLANADIESAIATTDSFVRKQYLLELKDAEILPPPYEVRSIEVGDNVRMFDITSLSVKNANEITEKIEDIYNSISDFDATPIFILDNDGFRSKLYLGIASNDMSDLRMYSDTFKGSFSSGFTGSDISILNANKRKDLLNKIFDGENSISSVSAVPTITESISKHGIERLVDGMRGVPFTMVVVSPSVPKQNIVSMRQTLEAMYTQISPMERQSVSLTNSESKSISQTFSLAKNESVTKGATITENTSITKGKTSSKTEVDNREKEREKTAKNQLVGTAISLVSLLGDFGKTSMNPLQGLFYGSSIGGIIGAAQTLINGPEQVDPTITTGESENYSLSYSEAETSSEQKGFTSSKGITDGTTENTGNTLQVTYENKSISNLLKVIDRQIERLQRVEETGGFNTTTYFVCGNNASALTAANMYKSLLNIKDGNGQYSAVNMWHEENDVNTICEYLKRLNHPLFRFKNKNSYPIFDPSVLVATDEFPMYSLLPQKSMPGLPVTSHAEFARDVIEQTTNETEKIEIGKIHHMGKTELTPVYLSKNNLSGHMFVAGTTGTGKSNFCYNLLNELQQTGTKFLVIEPAKGEYSKVFGGKDGVYAFGTNPNLTPLLTINPFSFCEGIHVNEHINRLIEIFNACWPMYAAMPQVLKEGIETIYENHGFNLVTGKSSKNTFPNFAELVEVLPEIINKSAYSGEVKGNYIGSLLTRIKSLTTGLYGCMFTNGEIDNKILFDENVLIDLSRVGSSETKSLIMGMLILKLQEYRMSNAIMNSDLKHVTVLEEAHHLLKACGGGSEEQNLRKMSLEMITNSIAEMRTYGEGFVIADQSPTLMDLSVIRNTNTKVIFKLPEYADRNCAGHSVSLNDEQISEVSRLETGVAVVYQSNWSHPVLVKTNYFSSDNFKPYEKSDTDMMYVDNKTILSQYMAILLKSRVSAEASSFDLQECKNIVDSKSYVDNKSKDYVSFISDNYKGNKTDIKFSELCKKIDAVINVKELFVECGDFSEIEIWEEKAKKYILKKVSLNDAEINSVILLAINMYASINANAKKLYFKYYAYTKKQK